MNLAHFKVWILVRLDLFRITGIIYNRLPRCLETLETKSINTNVDLITVYAGMDDKFFKFSADSGAEGIVVEALGVGNVPPLHLKV